MAFESVSRTEKALLQNFTLNQIAANAVVG
jgi:hypothetical protein